VPTPIVSLEPATALVTEIVEAINPLDLLEQQHIDRPLSWLATTDDTGLPIFIRARDRVSDVLTRSTAVLGRLRYASGNPQGAVDRLKSGHGRLPNSGMCCLTLGFLLLAVSVTIVPQHGGTRSAAEQPRAGDPHRIILADFRFAAADPSPGRACRAHWTHLHAGA